MMLQTDNYGMDIMCEKVDKSYQMRGLEWCCQMHDFKMFSFIQPEFPLRMKYLGIDS